jgi:aminomethyltransferase
VEFGGWEMPVYYTNVIEEHINTRTNASIFDTCHMGEFLIEGKEAIKFLQKVIAKDVEKLENGKCFYSVMCNEKGGVVDDLFLYRLSDNKFMIVANAGTIEKDLKHLVANRGKIDVRISNISNDMGKLDIQGPNSQKIMEGFLDMNLDDIKRFQFKETFSNKAYLIISRSGYTGEDGFEIYLDSKKAAEFWSKILETGKEYGLKPAGLGARDTLRIEACYSLYGHEINESISPIEAGIDFAVSIDKKENFIGKDALVKIKNSQKRVNVAFELTKKGIPREHYKVLKDGKEIGYVSSGTMSPTFRKGIGMALTDIQYSSIGTEIDINIREKPYKARIVKKPFYAYRRK